MLTRIITGLVMAVLVVLCFTSGPTWLQAMVVLVAAGLCLAELYGMALPGHPVERVVGIVLGVALLTVLWRAAEPPMLLMCALALFVPALLVVLRPMPIERAAFRLFVLWGSLIYIVVPLASALALIFDYGTPDGIAGHGLWILYVGASVWGGDTSAYFAGRAFGRHKLHPKVSPNKTWEGAIGGLIGSALGGLALVKATDLPLHTGQAIMFSLVGGAIAQVGDLVESLIKRACGVKDSGTLLPGHGGLLDRIDAFIVALPFFAAMILQA